MVMVIKFKNKQEFENYIKQLPCIGIGSQGVCYLDIKNNIVYKIFHSYFEEGLINEFSYDDFMKFSQIKNKTFIWPSNVITINDLIVGYTIDYKKANNLYRQDPLMVNLNQFENGIIKAQKDIKLLTNNDVAIYDIMYNILYTTANFYVIDTIEYENRKVSYNHNVKGFDYELKHFLTDGFFDDFIKANRLLLEQYKDSKASSLMFLKELKKQLSEYLDKKIITLGDAKKLVKKNVNHLYFRDIK